MAERRGEYAVAAAVVFAAVDQEALALEAAAALAVVVGKVREGRELGPEHGTGVPGEQKQVRHGVDHALRLPRAVVTVVAVIRSVEGVDLVVGKPGAEVIHVGGLVRGDEDVDAPLHRVGRASHQRVHEGIDAALAAVGVDELNLRGGFTRQGEILGELGVLARADVHGDHLVVRLGREGHGLHHVAHVFRRLEVTHAGGDEVVLLLVELELGVRRLDEHRAGPRLGVAKNLADVSLAPVRGGVVPGGEHGLGPGLTAGLVRGEVRGRAVQALGPFLDDEGVAEERGREHGGDGRVEGIVALPDDDELASLLVGEELGGGERADAVTEAVDRVEDDEAAGVAVHGFAESLGVEDVALHGGRIPVHPPPLLVEIVGEGDGGIDGVVEGMPFLTDGRHLIAGGGVDGRAVARRAGVPLRIHAALRGSLVPGGGSLLGLVCLLGLLHLDNLGGGTGGRDVQQIGLLRVPLLHLVRERVGLAEGGAVGGDEIAPPVPAGGCGGAAKGGADARAAESGVPAGRGRAEGGADRRGGRHARDGGRPDDRGAAGEEPRAVTPTPSASHIRGEIIAQEPAVRRAGGRAAVQQRRRFVRHLVRTRFRVSSTSSHRALGERRSSEVCAPVTKKSLLFQAASDRVKPPLDFANRMDAQSNFYAKSYRRCFTISTRVRER